MKKNLLKVLKMIVIIILVTCTSCSAKETTWKEQKGAALIYLEDAVKYYQYNFYLPLIDEEQEIIDKFFEAHPEEKENMLDPTPLDIGDGKNVENAIIYRDEEFNVYAYKDDENSKIFLGKIDPKARIE